MALLTGAGLDTLAVRVPDHPVALPLLRLAGLPIAAPSANRSGAVSPTSAAHVLDGLSGRIAAVLDSGACGVGVESTVLDLSGAEPVLLRARRDHAGGSGRLSRAGPPFFGGRSGDALAWYDGVGRITRRGLPVRPDVAAPGPDEVLLAFGPVPQGARCVFELSAAGDPAEAAARLFEGLRWLDAEGRRLGATGIAVMPVPRTGLGPGDQ